MKDVLCSNRMLLESAGLVCRCQRAAAYELIALHLLPTIAQHCTLTSELCSTLINLEHEMQQHWFKENKCLTPLASELCSARFNRRGNAFISSHSHCGFFNSYSGATVTYASEQREGIEEWERSATWWCERRCGSECAAWARERATGGIVAAGPRCPSESPDDTAEVPDDQPAAPTINMRENIFSKRQSMSVIKRILTRYSYSSKVRVAKRWIASPERLQPVHVLLESHRKIRQRANLIVPEINEHSCEENLIRLSVFLLK